MRVEPVTALAFKRYFTALTISSGSELFPRGASLCAFSNPESVCSPLGKVMPGANPHTRKFGHNEEAKSFVAVSRDTLLRV